MFDHGSRLGPAARRAETDRAEDLLTEIGQLEEQIAALQARQLLVTAELIESCRVLEFGRAITVFDRRRRRWSRSRSRQHAGSRWPQPSGTSSTPSSWFVTCPGLSGCWRPA